MKAIVIVVTALSVAGCSFSDYRTMHSSVLAADFLGSPQPADDVTVFIGDDVLPSDCRRVALLRAAPTATVVDRLREEAGRLGANAVDLRDFRNPAQDQGPGGDSAWNALALYCPEA